MQVLLASPRGFCAGVNMAIEALELALETLPTPIYVYHEIVHNKYVVESFRGRGVVFVNEPERMYRLGQPSCSRHTEFHLRYAKLLATETCVLSTPPAHLSRKCIWKRSSTPARVTRFFLIGHEGHDEVIGTMGEAPEAIILVETPERCCLARSH